MRKAQSSIEYLILLGVIIIIVVIIVNIIISSFIKSSGNKTVNYAIEEVNKGISKAANISNG
ncbi:class III signal peptide-containing protein [Pyrococcus abyssi]|nr:class III signal peptide-containing protein [Pyrococcus abyssi]